MARYLGKVRTNRKYNDLKVNIEERLDRIPNVGVSMAETIKNAKNSLKHLFVPGMFFEEMGIVYVGPIDGHDVESILTALEAAARMKNRPVLIHVVTKKEKDTARQKKIHRSFMASDHLIRKVEKCRNRRKKPIRMYLEIG